MLMMKLPLVGLVALACLAGSSARAVAIDEFDRHTSKHLREY